MCFSNFVRSVVALLPAALMVAACGGGGSTSTPAAAVLENVLPIRVDGGPARSGYNVNRLYTDVTVCHAGSSSQCQTIDHVLVDTGSTGLRLLSGALKSSLNLSRLTGSSGFPLINCVQFVDNTFAWGPVAMADIVLGGKTAPGVPIQLFGDPAFADPARDCAAGGTALTTAAALGANGIIGLGLFRQDCGAGCASVTQNGFYYTCTDAGCSAMTGARASMLQQLKNPVALFAADNNGVLIDLPAVNSPAAATLAGSLIFGIGTQSNNQLATARMMPTSTTGYITTRLAGQTWPTSFVDTGSNGIYFDSTVMPRCVGAGYDGFYCPDATVSLLASLAGVSTAAVGVTFSVGNARTLFGGTPNTVLPTLSGTMGDTSTVDWGLPFFYGRRVFIGLEGMTPSLAAGAFYAF